MDINLAIAIVVIVFAIIIVAGFFVYRRRGGADINGPWGMKLRVGGSNAGIVAKNLKSRTGGVEANDATGGGVDARDIEAEESIRITSQLASIPREVNKTEQAFTASLRSDRLQAGGNITIQQFVENRAPTAQQLQFFFEQIGIRQLVVTKYHESQFQAYCDVWRSLQALRLLGDRLWEEASDSNLLSFAEQLRRTELIVREGEIFYDDSHRQDLLVLLERLGDFDLGKSHLLELRSKSQIEMLRMEFDDQIDRQIEDNRNSKIEYEKFLEKIRVSFRQRLSRI